MSRKRRPAPSRARAEPDPNCAHAWSKWSDRNERGLRWRFCRKCKGLSQEQTP